MEFLSTNSVASELLLVIAWIGAEHALAAVLLASLKFWGRRCLASTTIRSRPSSHDVYGLAVLNERPLYGPVTRPLRPIAISVPKLERVTEAARGAKVPVPRPWVVHRHDADTSLNHARSHR